MTRTGPISRPRAWILAALVGVLVVLANALLSKPVVGVGYALATAAVSGVALLAGAGPALFTAGLIASGSIALVPGMGSLETEPEEALHLVTFGFATLFATWMGAAYRRSRRRTADLLASITDGLLVFDREGRLTYLNEAAERMLGTSGRALLGRTAWESLPATALGEPLRRVMATGSAAAFETRLPGQDRWFEVRANPARDGGVLALFHDVTAEKEATARAAQLSEEMRALHEANVVGFLATTPDGRVVDANDYYLALTGHSREELEAGTIAWGDRTAPEFRHRDARALEEIFRSGRSGAYGNEYVRPDGSRAWALAAGALVSGEGNGDRMVVFTLDITQRRRAEEELRRHHRILDAIVESSSAPIYVKDAEGRFLLVNSATAAIFGATKDAVIGKSERDLLPTGSADVFRADDLEVIASRSPRIFEESVPREDGVHTYISSKFPVLDAEGAVLGIGGVSADVTPLKRIEEALRARERELVEADRRKDEFLAILSHELRNPLAPIRNGMAILERSGVLDGRSEHLVRVVNRQVAQLTRLVDDLLDVTRISRGKIRLQRERVDLAALARRTGDDHRVLFERNRISFAVEVPEDPVWVDGDPARLAQVTGNILQNAAKFTPRNGRVALRLEEHGERVDVSVADSGVGLERPMLEEVFEPFRQVDRSLERSRGGLGLGLALARAIVDLHGGSIGAASEGPGRGATFTFTLPRAEAPGPAREEPAAPSAAAAPLRILIVEDNRDAADTLREVLEMEGHDVSVAYTGPHGLRLVKDLKPDVVLCDIGLPEMDGYDLARAVRCDPVLEAVRLVALTGYALPEDQRRAAEAGFDRHLAKPPDLRKLDSLLAEIRPRLSRAL